MRSNAFARSSVLLAGAPALALAVALLGACRPRSFNEGSGTTQDAWNSLNDPTAFFNTRGVKMTFKFDAAKTSGRLDKQPWSETYWPDFAGGIAVRWQDPRGLHGGTRETRRDTQGREYQHWVPPPAIPKYDAWRYDLNSKDQLKKLKREEIAKLSPAEKYDIYMGRYSGSGAYPLVQAERTRTTHTNGGLNQVQPWWGLCHAWAPASLLYAEPKPVDVVNADGITIPFASSDIKALIIHYFHQTNHVHAGIGGRCERAKDPVNPTRTAAGQGSQDECKDVNAGAWHVLVTNLVKANSPTSGFVFDMDKSSEVWNQPIYSYSASYGTPTDRLHKGAGPATAKSVRVRSTVQFGKEVNPAWTGNIASGKNSLGKLELEYYLELDKQGNIIGGEWITDDFPDFVWYRSRPRSFAFQAGGVDYSGIDKILAASAGGRLSAPPAGGSSPGSVVVPTTTASGSGSPSSETSSGSTPGSVVVPTVPSSGPIFTDPFANPPSTTSASGLFGTTPPGGTGTTSGAGTANPAPPANSDACVPNNRWKCSQAWPRCGWNIATNKCYTR